MKLDATDLRYISSDEFRVLTAVEMGSKNHEVVPTVLIAQISGLRNGGVNKLIGSLAKRNLVSKVQNAKYDGYRLTYGGYDYLAMRALSKRDSMHSVGNQIGVGKESDIYIVADAEGKEMVLKLHRLGRISFRTIKQNRDYLGKRKSASWMYMSRLAAQKEWAFMKVLYEHEFPVPKPIDQARHCILMEFIDAYPLRQIADVPSPGKLYSTLMDLIVRFARAGLIHGDFNEFNILIRRSTGEPVVIDFPQMVSTSHENAEWRRFKYESVLYPKFKRSVTEEAGHDGFRLDVEVAASGFSRKDQKTLEEASHSLPEYMQAVKEDPEEDESNDMSESSDESHNSEEEYDDDDNAEKVGDEGDAELRLEGQNHNRADNDVAQPSYDSLENAPERSSDEAADEPPSSNCSELSRSPPHSRSNSPIAREVPRKSKNIKDAVSSTLEKERSRQQRKYHSKRSTRRAGRPGGSKAKQDNRVKLDRGWD
ncbi:Serine/threonine-protein kinase rio2 [Paramarasmius palmivorus]|uniref:Serine/threonine-protein kinase RIO2 n=1 Tax=Paramarasmius palmivorus TaxID=297713 RepID=A0AAW0E361_9AGAR